MQIYIPFWTEIQTVGLQGTLDIFDFRIYKDIKIQQISPAQKVDYLSRNPDSESKFTTQEEIP